VEHSPARPLADQLTYAVSYVPVLAAALAGIWVRRRALRHDLILWCIVLTFVAVHVVYFPATRYRAPMEFVLLFYAAVGIGALVETGLSRGGGAPAAAMASGASRRRFAAWRPL